MSAKMIDAKETAKLVRKALKEAFPGVKFSVRINRYSGGCSMNIEYTDGPSKDQVWAIACKFEGAKFDGMNDLKTLVNCYLDGDKVFFETDYVFLRRDISDDFSADIANTINYLFKVDYDAEDYCQRKVPYQLFEAYRKATAYKSTLKSGPKVKY